MDVFLFRDMENLVFMMQKRLHFFTSDSRVQMNFLFLSRLQ